MGDKASARLSLGMKTDLAAEGATCDISSPLAGSTLHHPRNGSTAGRIFPEAVLISSLVSSLSLS